MTIFNKKIIFALMQCNILKSNITIDTSSQPIINNRTYIALTNDNRLIIPTDQLPLEKVLRQNTTPRLATLNELQQLMHKRYQNPDSKIIIL